MKPKRKPIVDPLIVWLCIVVLIITISMAFISRAQNESYDKSAYENCKQYEIIPEKYIDKVPSGCIPQWFKANQ